jgi:pseudaminic acid biosynthesis-associated methylase
LQALHRIRNNFELRGYEIHSVAASDASKSGIAEIINDTVIKNLPVDRQFDLVFTKGVLIHINPAHLTTVYKNLVALSKRYVLVCEYYNPTPVAVPYRGNEDRLFKRDFAGEIMDLYGLTLVDYGFCYSRDQYFTSDDSTWFLMEKPL